MNLEEMFEKHEKKYIHFEQVDNRLSNRPDLHAFILLDKLTPSGFTDRDLIGGAEHDEIFLDVDCRGLAEVATEEDVITLIRCGVRYDSDTGSLAMFA